jgi:antiviral helicase SLH1
MQHKLVISFECLPPNKTSDLQLQNGGRIIRALLEIAVSRKYASTAANLAQMSLAVEKRMWPFVNPMAQFTDLHRDVLHNLSLWADHLAPYELAQYNPRDLGALIHMNHIHGGALLKAAKQFPHVDLSVRVRPLTAELLRIQVEATRDFDWSAKWHGQREPFWLWTQDEEGSQILQFTRVAFLGPGEPRGAGITGRNGGGSSTNVNKGGQWTAGSSDVLRAEFMIPLRAVTGPNKSITIRLISDRWVGAIEEVPVSLQDVVFPKPGEPSTPVLNLPFLPLGALSEPRLEARLGGWSIPTLNGMQTQAFYALVQTVQNVLLAGPSANGKSTLVLAAVWYVFYVGIHVHCD